MCVCAHVFWLRSCRSIYRDDCRFLQQVSDRIRSKPRRNSMLNVVYMMGLSSEFR